MGDYNKEISTLMGCWGPRLMGTWIQRRYQRAGSHHHGLLHPSSSPPWIHQLPRAAAWWGRPAPRNPNLQELFCTCSGAMVQQLMSSPNPSFLTFISDTRLVGSCLLYWRAHLGVLSGEQGHREQCLAITLFSGSCTTKAEGVGWPSLGLAQCLAPQSSPSLWLLCGGPPQQCKGNRKDL